LPGALRQRGYVETNCVGEVEYFPAELQTLGFCNGPRLAKTAVDAEKSRPAEFVTLSRLAGQRKTKRSLCP